MPRQLPSILLLAGLAACARPTSPARIKPAVPGAGPRATGPVVPAARCGPAQPDVPTCPRGWGACLVTEPGRPVRLHQPGLRSPLATVVWQDLDGDGVRDVEQRYQHDARGNVTRVWVDGNGNGLPEHEGRASFDGRGLLVERWQDAGFDGSAPRVAAYAYDAGGRLLAGREVVGQTRVTEERHEYDGQGQLVRRGETRYAYGPTGLVVREWTGGWDRRLEHDARGLVVREWTSTGYETKTQRDGSGRPVEIVTTSGTAAPTVWRASYDPDGRVTRTWTERAGALITESRHRYDAGGHELEQWDDHDGDGKANKVEHSEYTPTGLIARRWYDLDGDGKPEGDTSFEYDAAGHLVRQLEAPTSSNPRPTSDVRWAYQGERLVRMWNELVPGYEEAYRHDADGNVLEVIRQQNGLAFSIHFEVDAAAVAALRAVAPPSCPAPDPAAPPTPSPPPLPDYPQPLPAGFAEAAPRVSAAVPVLPPLPKPGRDGKVAAEPGLRLWFAYRAHLRTLTDAALRARGWRRAPLHHVDPDTDPALVRGVRVARASQSCSPDPEYVVDDKGQVFLLQPALACGRSQTLAFRGDVPYEGGCGVEPPPQDVYAEAPAGARLLAKGPALTVSVPLCLDLQPEGVGPPPP